MKKTFRYIFTTKGRAVLVSWEDFDMLSKFRWCASGAYTKAWIGTHYTSMHRFLLGEPLGCVDHINGNPDDNRRPNLRLTSMHGNAVNRHKLSTNTSGYRGVCWDKQTKKWLASIMVHKKNRNLGRFNNKDDAARAYDVAALRYFGEYARLNKPFCCTPHPKDAIEDSRRYHGGRGKPSQPLHPRQVRGH